MKDSSLIFLVIGLLTFVLVILVLVLVGEQSGFLSARLWRNSVYPTGVPVEVPAELPAQGPDISVPGPDQADGSCQLICQRSCSGFGSAEQEQACLGECLGLCETEY